MKTVLKAVELLQNAFEISDLHIQNGFKNVISNTGLLGRWQILNKKPFVVTDTAHNAHGLKIVLSQIQKHEFETLHIVLGVVNDKDLDSILPLFPKNAKYYFSKPNLPRGLDATVLRDEASKYGLKGKIYDSVSEAYENALDCAIVTDFIYVGGSTFVVAEII
jgi:dihydrofolate synthase/folylpolyglutamate synthase